MKKFVLRNIQVVGMHHYCRRELDRLGSYIVDIKANNSYDRTAVAVYDGNVKFKILKTDIECITQMVNKHSIIYAKVMELSSKRST
jgi:hypothetical protein